jgi:DNA-binding GntR family transcriptional regulator
MDRPEDGAYEELRSAIATGRLQPNERLVEADLASAFGVGRAAVRTALVRLEQDGIVERERHRGARVRLVSEAEAIEILEARAVLEGIAAAYAARHATDADVRALEGMVDELARCVEHGDLLRYSEGNVGLHRAIGELARHGTVSRLTAMLDAQNVRHQFRTILAPGRPRRSLEEHVEIVAAIARRDPDAAEEAMRRHLENVACALRELSPRTATALTG